MVARPILLINCSCFFFLLISCLMEMLGLGTISACMHVSKYVNTSNSKRLGFVCVKRQSQEKQYTWGVVVQIMFLKLLKLVQILSSLIHVKQINLFFFSSLLEYDGFTNHHVKVMDRQRVQEFLNLLEDDSIFFFDILKRKYYNLNSKSIQF